MDPGYNCNNNNVDKKSAKKLKKKKRKKEKSKHKPVLTSETSQPLVSTQTSKSDSEQFVSRIFVPFSSSVFQDNNSVKVEHSSNANFYNKETENIINSNNNLTICIKPQLTHHTLPRTNPIIVRSKSDARIDVGIAGSRGVDSMSISGSVKRTQSLSDDVSPVQQVQEGSAEMLYCNTIKQFFEATLSQLVR